MCPSTTTFTLSVEKMSTMDIKDKHDGMLPQIVTAFKKMELRNKNMTRIQEGKQVNTEQIINISRSGKKPNNP